jgi:hypothetical protein
MKSGGSQKNFQIFDEFLNHSGENERHHHFLRDADQGFTLSPDQHPKPIALKPLCNEECDRTTGFGGSVTARSALKCRSHFQPGFNS